MAGRSVGPCSVVGGSVEDRLLGRWSVGRWKACRWVRDRLPVVGGLLMVDGFIIRLF